MCTYTMPLVVIFMVARVDIENYSVNSQSFRGFWRFPQNFTR